MRATIHVLGGQGYVWDAAEAHWLRLECGLVGAMVGGVAGFKQQNAVHGLPLQLSPEEVTLALEKGWGMLTPALNVASQAAPARKRRRSGFHDSDDEGQGSYHDESDDGDDVMADAQPPAWREALSKGAAFTIPVAMEGARTAVSGGGGGGGAAKPGGPPAAAGTAAAQQAACPSAEAGIGAAEAASKPAEAQAQQQEAGGGAMLWEFPTTQEERHRYWVFRDLHQAGYRITGGSKFGADYLVYPGDPTLFHAQFCVRVLPFRAPLLPALLAAACRGSHQARKHLLLASVAEGESDSGDGKEEGRVQVESEPGKTTAGTSTEPGSQGPGGEEFRIHYMTIGPVEGFG